MTFTHGEKVTFLPWDMNACNIVNNRLQESISKNEIDRKYLFWTIDESDKITLNIHDKLRR